MLSHFEGASWSTNQGWVYWPTLNPRNEVDTGSRVEVARRAHWLRNNIGLARRLGTGITNLVVGTGLNPQAMTKDADWNHLAEKAYKNRARSGLSYSVNGRFTGVKAQKMMVNTRFYDGEAAVVFAKSDSGGALRGFYSGLQIGNHSNPRLDQSQWSDGIRYDALDRATHYRFPGDNGTFTDVEAANVRFLCRPDSPGSRRAMSALVHAVNKMIKITDLNNSVMKGIMAAQDIGFYLTSNSDEKRQPGIPDALGGKVAAVQTPAGPLKLRQVYGQGGIVPSLPKGMDLKTLLDARPHPNLREFTEDFIRDVSWGTGISSDLLWNIYKLGGANVRYVLADAQTFISSEQQDLVDDWLAPDWVWAIALEMQAGRLRQCNDPEWYLHGWIPPARVTVDYGRDGRILLDWNRAGLLTTSRFYLMQGQMAKQEISSELELIAWHKTRMQELGLTPDDLVRWYSKSDRITITEPVDNGNKVDKSSKTGNPPEDDNEEDDAPMGSDAEQKNLREMIQQEIKEIALAT